MTSSGDELEPFARGQRLDKWLWHARFARTRPAAAQLIADGHVRINGKREGDRAKRVREGDVLTVALGHGVRIVRLRGFATRRGSAADVQHLYESVDMTNAQESRADDGCTLLAPPGQSR